MAETTEPFSWIQRSSGQVEIIRNGAVVTTLRGTSATRFLAQVSPSDGQRLMARVTGNYRRGNERAASQHPRNHQA